MLLSTLLSLCLIVLSSVEGQPSLIARAKQEIIRRERNFIRTGSTAHFRTFHPERKSDFTPPLQILAHHPIAYKLREAIYTQKDVLETAKTDVGQAIAMIAKAIGDLPTKQRVAVQNLPPRTFGENETAVAAPRIDLPVEVSFMVTEMSVYAHICEELKKDDGTHVNALLMEAAKNDRDDLIDYLIWLGANPEPGYRYEMTPLYSAVYRNHLQAAERLIFYGANIMWKPGSGTPLLYYAVYNGNVPLARMLMNEVDVRWKESTGEPMSFFAIASGNLDMVKLIMENGGHTRYDNNRSLIHQAVEMGALDIAEYLITHGGVDEDQDVTRQVYTSILKNEPAMLALLLQFRVNLDWRNSFGWRLIEVAFHVRGNSELLRLLLSDPVRVSHPSAYDSLKLALAQRRELVPVFLESGVDPNGRENESLLLSALELQDWASAELLYDHHADVDQTINGLPLIMHAETEDKATIVEWLINHGASQE